MSQKDDQSDHVSIKFSIELNKLLLSNRSWSVCTIEQIDELYKQKSEK